AIVGLSSSAHAEDKPTIAAPASKSFIMFFIVPPLENALFAGRFVVLGMTVSDRSAGAPAGRA
ncbi:hypothetical protein ACCT04_37360, partial [Rhizobium ruizarguesonis]